MEQREFKKVIEDKEEVVTGYRNFSDVELLKELQAMKDRVVKLENPLDTRESDALIEEFGASMLDAEAAKHAEVQTLQNQIKELEDEMARRKFLN